jgi:hypothetical protein
MFRQDFLIRLPEGDRMKKIVVIMMTILMIKNVQQQDFKLKTAFAVSTSFLSV